MSCMAVYCYCDPSHAQLDTSTTQHYLKCQRLLDPGIWISWWVTAAASLPASSTNMHHMLQCWAVCMHVANNFMLDDALDVRLLEEGLIPLGWWVTPR